MLHLKFQIFCLNILHFACKIIELVLKTTHLLLKLDYLGVRPFICSLFMSSVADSKLILTILLLNAGQIDDHFFFSWRSILEEFFESRLTQEITYFLFWSVAAGPLARRISRQIKELSGFDGGGWLFGHPLFFRNFRFLPVLFEVVGEGETFRLLSLVYFLRLGSYLRVNEGVAVCCFFCCSLFHLYIFLDQFFFLFMGFVGWGSFWRTDAWGWVGRVQDCLYFFEDVSEVGPVVGFFFWEDSIFPKLDFECSNLGENGVLVSVGVDVLVFCDFKGYEVWRDHIANDLELRVALGEHFGYWMGQGVRLRKVSWYLNY